MQQSNLDITEWIKWFLNCLINSLKSTDIVVSRVLFKAEFWKRHSNTKINERQIKLLNKRYAFVFVPGTGVEPARCCQH